MREDVYIKIAYWYYTLGMTQDEIAKRLSFTRQKVNQIINSLVDLGIVNISIQGYERNNIELECQLEDRFGLKRAVIATDYGERDTVLYKVANVAAQYLNDTIRQGDIIGVSWGRTLSEVVNQMVYHKRSDCQVVQLMGAQNIEQKVEKSDEIARNLANKLDCPSNMLYAPVVVEHKMTKQMLMKERSIQASFELMNKCNVAIIGVGELTEQSTMCTRGHITKEDVRVLREAGFVGDIAMNPIRADGSWDHCPLTERSLNASIECLKRIKNVILVACGDSKVDATCAAMQTGCIDILITDETTARKVLNHCYYLNGEENEQTRHRTLDF